MICFFSSCLKPETRCLSFIIISATWQRLQHALPACRGEAVRQKTGESVKATVALRIETICGMRQTMRQRLRFLQKVLTQVRPKAVWKAFSGIPDTSFTLCPWLLGAPEASS
jgi:hypothetical protein